MFQTKNYDKYDFIETPSGADYITCPFCCKLLQDRDEVDDPLYPFDTDTTTYEFCKDCNIFFGICCSYEINGCTDDLYYPTVLELTDKMDKDNIFKNPILPREKWSEIKNFSHKMFCLCPGFCPSGPNAYYKEYNGLGLRCCKKLSEDILLKNKQILKERILIKNYTRSLSSIKHLKTRFIERNQSKSFYYMDMLKEDPHKLAKVPVKVSKNLDTVICPSCDKNVDEDPNLSRWINLNCELPFFYCDKCMLIFTCAEHSNYSRSSGELIVLCPILVYSFSYKNKEFIGSPLFRNKEELMYRVPLLKLKWKQICIPNDHQNSYVFIKND